MTSEIKKLNIARVQSPSSINTYKQCPRKYYYCYIEKLPGRPSIHLTRGKIVHSVLENFFKVDISKLSEDNALFVMKVFINDMMEQQWRKQNKELNNLGLTTPQLEFYHIETKDMVNNWYGNFTKKMAIEMKEYPLPDSFKRLTPKTEIEYKSAKYGVRGFIDAIHEKDGEIVLMDYKTSKAPKMSKEYRLQLGLYALMYHETHEKMPNKVGIDFLKFGEQLLDVDEELINNAKFEAELIHMNTATTKKEDFPLKQGPLCKYSTGQCDFYDKCFGKHCHDC
ncbi:MAG: PD-(D/E)XK nuclease family protein [Candidatus Woesearchaeota archaeon]|jgi:ATP-dependent exoDNAse (exonuclease V) beta subunit